MPRSGFEWAKSLEDAAHRLVPHQVDDLARDEPERVVYELADANDVSKPFEKVTAQRYANAINRAAAWLENALGRREGFPTVGYLGPQDLRYLILVIATIKAGYKILFISSRNSLEGDIAVIQASDCKFWLVPSQGSNIHRVLDSVQMSTFSLPDLSYFLDSQLVPHYPYNKTWEEGKRDPLWVVHTSGSTGNPKPVFRYLDSAAASGANTLMPKINGRPLLLHDYFDSRAYVTFPLFHAAGLANGLLWPLFYGSTVILGPQKPVELDLMKDVIRYAKPDTIFTPPSVVQEIAKDDEFLILLETVKAIGYGGGPVSQEAGDRIWKHTKLRLSIGVSEAGNLPCVETDPEDWNYLHFHPNNGFELQDREAGLYELVAVRKPELEPWQPIFSTFPDLQSYSFKDLFSKHPTKPDLYTYEGRADSILVLSNGEKVQPHFMETTITAHPLVDSAVVAGQGRFQTCLIVELSGTYPLGLVEKEQIIDQIWPLIKEANKCAPKHAQILRDFVILGSPDKPFSKTSKGTVRRGPTLQLYQAELDHLYAAAETDIAEGHVKLNAFNFFDFRIALRRVIESVTDIPDLNDDQDLFAAGVDSLQVLTLNRVLQKSVQWQNGTKPSLSTALIYRNPTINLLARALFDAVGVSLPNQVQGEHTPSNGTGVTVEGLIQKYTSGLDRTFSTRKDGFVVILTGSTGSLGSYLLNELIESEKIDEIWCLNRSLDAETRQRLSNEERGLRVDFENRGVLFRQASLANERLGLSQEDYTYLLNNATHFIHTQWQVDFNLQLISFEPHIQGIRNLVDFGLASLTHGKRIRIVFTSSVGVANLLKSDSAVPERRIEDYTIAGPGYGESKLVAEAVLLEASERAGLDVTVCRVGQIAGPVGVTKRKGSWNRKEWFPSIVDASAHMALLPQTLGRNESIEWIPVDILSSILVELSFYTPEEAKTSRIFHCVNPLRVRWADSILPTIQARLAKRAKGGEVGTAPLNGWVEALKRASEGEDGSEPDDLSAFKLISFFAGLSAEGRPEFETGETRRASTILNELEAVSTEWVDIWLDQWGL